MNGEAAAPPGTAAETAVRSAAEQVVRRLVADDSADPPLKRRARAARRSPPLAERCRGRLASTDPLLAGHAAWQDEHDVLMARLGWAPRWQRERARDAWLRGVR